MFKTSSNKQKGLLMFSFLFNDGKKETAQFEHTYDELQQHISRFRQAIVDHGLDYYDIHEILYNFQRIQDMHPELTKILEKTIDLPNNLVLEYKPSANSLPYYAVNEKK
jgi:hypothetical protein